MGMGGGHARRELRAVWHALRLGGEIYRDGRELTGIDWHWVTRKRSEAPDDLELVD